MKREGSVDLFHYWNRLRDGRPAPRRTEIEPADIKTLLGDTFILESDSRGEAVFRLAGTRLCATYGRELKGFAFSSLWREKDGRMVARLVRSVFREKTVLVITYQGLSRGGRSLSLELLLLPLDGGQENQRALGISSPDSKPFWLGSDPLVESSIETVRVVDPNREPLFLKNRIPVPIPSPPTAGPGFSAAEPFRQAGRRIRHLIVLPGGRVE